MVTLFNKIMILLSGLILARYVNLKITHSVFQVLIRVVHHTIQM